MLSTLELAALLSGQGGKTSDLLSDLIPVGAGPNARTCIDAGADCVFALRAPGPRSFDVQVRAGDAWHGVRTVGPVRSWRRWVVPGLPDDPSSRGDAEEFGRAGRVLAANGRVWSVEQDDRARTVSWRIDRHLPVAEVLELAGIGDAWPPAAAALDVLHGFPVSATSGPWSVALRFEQGRLCPVRIGTTRWAWSAEDEGKKRRLAAWIESHGGDGGFAAALYDLIAASTGARRSIGRAAEVDVSDATVVSVSAYLVSERSPSWHG